jgi:hypothetical protein
MNIALMLKWVWKLFQPENPIWAQIIRAKYPSANNIFAGSGHGGSQFWRSLHKIKHLFKLGARHSVQDGNRTLFWMDKWFGDVALKDRFPALFSIANAQMITVGQVCRGGGALSFRRSLDHLGIADWHLLRSIIDQTHLVPGQDRVT